MDDHAIDIIVPEMNSFVRLPAYMRDANKGLFEPRVVSIGPYHRGKESTHDMEAHKERYIHGFFRRSGNVSREYYVNDMVVSNCIVQARQCYSGKNVEEDYSSEMLMRDGCFIIELLLRWKEGKALDDTYVRLMWNSIYYDLLLVDNQIPFFVLERIFRVFMFHNLDPDFNGTQLIQLVIKLFNHEGQFSWAKLEQLAPDENLEQLILDLLDADRPVPVRHLLDLQYNLVISKNIGNDLNLHNCHQSSMPRGIPGANELQDYGVRFELNEGEQVKLFDVTFKGKTMRIPPFEINFGSNILLANLFAHDQILAQPSNDNQQGSLVVGPVTSYVVLMNALINTRKDVVVLQRKRIVDNLLSNEEEVASLFNELGRCALLDLSKHRYTSMFKDVNRYLRNKFNCCQYCAIFSLKHCKNPLTFFSLLGGSMLLIFSCTSMIFAVLKYTCG